MGEWRGEFGQRWRKDMIGGVHLSAGENKRKVNKREKGGA
jgi:hypothetical protein